MRKIYNLILLCALLFITLYCKKSHQNIGAATGCVVLTSPSYFGTTQTFSYDGNANMVGRKYDFGVGSFGPFSQTIDGTRTHSSYHQGAVLLEETDIFYGGTGNLYDGKPAGMIKHEQQTGGSANYDHTDTPYTFKYDEKNRLTTVYYWPALNISDIPSTYARQRFAVVLSIGYDNNGNAIALRQVEVFRYGTYVVQAPSESHFEFDSVINTVINVTYDQKPSPFSATLKYWKFVQNDWGLASNTNWQAIITALSPNNPLTVSYSYLRGNNSTQKYNMSYNYNDQGYPSDSYTYQCH